jgi:nitrite reductase/ring-hydroxylating ferredoxin subunit
MQRREFCVNACQAISLATLASLLEGCGGSPTSPSAAPALPTINAAIVGSVLTLTIDSGSPLANAGAAALVQASGRAFLVARAGQDTFVALTAVCTHEGCTVTGFQNQTYVCPCHGSTYNTSGAVLSGPATRALQQFPTRFANNVLTITAA